MATGFGTPSPIFNGAPLAVPAASAKAFRLSDGTEFRLVHGYPAFQIWHDLIADSEKWQKSVYVETENGTVTSVLPSKRRQILAIGAEQNGYVRIEFEATDPFTFVHTANRKASDLSASRARWRQSHGAINAPDQSPAFAARAASCSASYSWE
jgi:hypothetical protein